MDVAIIMGIEDDTTAPIQMNPNFGLRKTNGFLFVISSFIPFNTT